MGSGRTAAARVATLLVAAMLTVTGCAGEVSPGDSEPTDPGAGAPAAAVTPPPADTGFDYQLGGAYAPPEGTGIVVRDSTAKPGRGPGRRPLRLRDHGGLRDLR